MNRILPLVVLSLCGWLTSQVQWKPGVELGARLGHAMAWDPVRQRVLMFGGSGRDDLWEFDGATWTPHTPPLAPPGRTHHAMAYDPLRGRLVVFGGTRTIGATNVETDDTWEWDGTRWAQAAPPVRPVPRSGARMAFDPTRRKVLLYGGMFFQAGQGVFLDDTWEWDGVQWAQANPATRPPARAHHAMSEDPVRSRVVVHGGQNPPILSDTWEWDGTTWQATPAAGPVLLPGAAACFDAATGRTLVLGLFDARYPQTPRMETWAYDGSAWTLRAADTLATRQYVAMAYDRLRGRAVAYGGGSLFGTVTGDTWELSGTGWTLALRAAAPLFNFQSTPSLVYDVQRNVMVLVGNGPNSVETWENAGAGWTLRQGVAGPYFFITIGHAATYDPARGQTLLFGGNSPYGNDQTWVYDGTTWSQLTVSPRPPGQYGHSMAFDERRGRVVLFGGRGWGYPSITWEWDGSRWTDMQPVHKPVGRRYAAMAWHPGRQRVLLYGGGDFASPSFADLWEWDGSDWTQLSPSVPSGARSRHGMVYDAWRDRLVVYGGWTGDRFLDDTWEWDGGTWTQRTPAANPGTATNFAMAFDPTLGTTLLFGGHTYATWSYSPVAPAVARTFGAGCQGSAGVPAFSAEPGSRPWLGGEYRQVLTRVPSGTVAMIELGLSDRSWYGLPLPFDLTAIGMTGCRQLCSTDLLTPIATGSGSATHVIPIPADPWLAGLTFYAQAFTVDATANPFGATLSNGVESRIGAR